MIDPREIPAYAQWSAASRNISKIKRKRRNMLRSEKWRCWEAGLIEVAKFSWERKEGPIASA